MTNIVVNIPADTAAELQRLASTRGMSVIGWLREAIATAAFLQSNDEGHIIILREDGELRELVRNDV